MDLPKTIEQMLLPEHVLYIPPLPWVVRNLYNELRRLDEWNTWAGFVRRHFPTALHFQVIIAIESDHEGGTYTCIEGLRAWDEAGRNLFFDLHGDADTDMREHFLDLQCECEVSQEFASRSWFVTRPPRVHRPLSSKAVDSLLQHLKSLPDAVVMEDPESPKEAL